MHSIGMMDYLQLIALAVRIERYAHSTNENHRNF